MYYEQKLYYYLEEAGSEIVFMEFIPEDLKLLKFTPNDFSFVISLPVPFQIVHFQILFLDYEYLK